MITGKDIHRAFCRIEPQARAWNDISLRAQRDYEAVAEELNQLIDDDVVTVSVVRCPHCNEMVHDEHIEYHPCFV
jgi:hypothetical protein